MIDAISLAKALITRQSLTPDDAGCQEILIPLLKKLGFCVTSIPYKDTCNFWAVRGEERPMVVFAGHTDVVPTGNVDLWQFPPFSATEHNGFLHGRGAADMKASLAAMVTATAQFIEQYPQHAGSIAFLITSAEEGPSEQGTPIVLEYLQQQSIEFDWCLVGEPTCDIQLGDTIKNGRRGSLTGHLIVQGKQGHIAYPHLANNPIHQIAAALHALVQHHWDDGNAFFAPTCFQISNIHAGTGAGNVIPEQLDMLFNFRYSPEVTATYLQNTVETLLKTFGVDYTLHWTHYGEPFLTEPGALTTALANAIQKECGIEPQLSTSGGTSDARYIAKTGAQVVEFGLSNALIHQVNECVPVRDITCLQAIYFNLLVSLLGAK